MENLSNNIESANFKDKKQVINLKTSILRKNSYRRTNSSSIKSTVELKSQPKRKNSKKANNSAIEEEEVKYSPLKCVEDISNSFMEEEECKDPQANASFIENSTCPNSNDKSEIEYCLQKDIAETSQITKFETEERNSLEIDPDTLKILRSSESSYHPNSAYIDLLQSEMTKLMRSVLLDWMMNISSYFNLKRETFYMAVNFVDRYLSKKKNVPKLILQLIGTTALYVASKIEEIYPPELEYFHKACNKEFSLNELLEMEIDILYYLSFKMNPPTAVVLFNFYSSQWDALISFHTGVLAGEKMKFREHCEESFRLFLKTTQIIDLISLDYDSLAYETSQLVLAAIYVSLSYNVSEISKANPNENVQRDFLVTFEQFYEAVSENKTIALFEDCIQFVSPFFELSILYDFPRAIAIGVDEEMNQVHEQVLSYQIFNPNNLDFMKAKYMKDNITKN